MTVTFFLKVSFIFMERYMSQPTEFASIPRLLPGESVEMPIAALFNESMLNLTENINANALVLVDYRPLAQAAEAGFLTMMI